MLYRIKDGSISRGGKEILSHVDFEIKGSEKIALCGENGAGKTTLLELIAGSLDLDRDDKRQGPGIMTAGLSQIAYLPQHVFADPEHGARSVEEELLDACPCKDSFDRERFDYEQEYDRLFTGFGFKKEDKKRRLDSFSGGEQTRIALIRLMLMKPDFLLLDEPTNHLDEAMTEWLEEWIRSYDKAVLMVSHDRYFLDNTAEIVYEIHNHRMTKYAGNYSFYMEEKERIRLRHMEEWKRQQEEVDRLEGLIRKFHNKPRKASFARSRQKILDRMELMEKPDASSMRPFHARIEPAVLPAKYVVEAEECRIGYDRALMEISLRVKRGQKIGIIGPNGIGKTTFLKTVAGFLDPLKGKCQLGLRVEMGWYDQHQADFSGEGAVLGHFREKYPGLSEKEARGKLAAWRFPGKMAAKQMANLSGGEKARLAFCELFEDCPNLLLLDEPTNHMDIASREMLESALRAYEGTILFISHDRYFVDRVAQSLLVFDESGVKYYPFGYRHYKERLKRQEEYRRLVLLKAREEDGEESPAGSRKEGAEADFSEVGAMIQAEDMALIDGLKAVPEAEKRFIRLSNEEIYLDWKRRLMEEDLARCEDQLVAYEEELAALEERMDAIWLCEPDAGEEYEELKGKIEEIYPKKEAMCERLTELCLLYDEELSLST